MGEVENLKNLAIITARSGSKGLKNKNILDLIGKPLMAYTIEAAIDSAMFNRVHVSTDSENYANIAKDFGADVPFLRSNEMSSDTASSWDAVREVVHMYNAMGEFFDTITILQPTSPLRIAEDIVNGFSLFEEKQANVIVSVCEMDHSPLWCNKLQDNLSLENFIAKENAVNRQGLDTYYRINGALYIIKAELIEHDLDLYNEKSFAYIMPKERSIDIDTELDFMIAKAIMSRKN